MNTLYDNYTLKVLGFLQSKGLLFVDDVTNKPTVKLDLLKVLEVGTKIEPRVLEVLPAALIHFPRTFTNQAAMPVKLKAVIEAIKSNYETGPDLAGIPFTAMRRWANVQLKDKRSVPLTERRQMKSLRFKPSTLAILSAKAKARNISETELLESLIQEG